MIKKLSKIKMQGKYKIEGLDCDDELYCWMLDRGLYIGNTFKITGIYSSYYMLKINGTKITIDKEMADIIIVVKNRRGCKRRFGMQNNCIFGKRCEI
jgi:hypothetical protein